MRCARCTRPAACCSRSSVSSRGRTSSRWSRPSCAKTRHWCPPRPCQRPNAICPYLGLVPYGIDDSDAFYGRDNEIDASLRRLTAVGVLVVVGPSGSGKSSLVRAGVAAALVRAGRRVVVITPGGRPMDALTVLSSDGPAPALVVDQCEEIATLCDAPAQRAMFFAALTSTRRGPLVIALRADRLGELSAHPAVRAPRRAGPSPLERDERRRPSRCHRGPGPPGRPVVGTGPRRPARARGGRRASSAAALVARAPPDVAATRGRTLTVEGYQRTGGIKGSVAQTAEAIYHEVPPDLRPSYATCSSALSLRRPRVSRYAPAFPDAPSPRTSNTNTCWRCS